MRFRSSRPRAVVLLVSLLAAAAVTAGAEGTGAYLDVTGLGMGIGFSALNLRAGMQIPLQGKWSFAPEAQVYVTFPSDTLFTQVDALVVFRCKPWDGLGLYVGAGPGVGGADSRALGSAGGPSASDQIGVKAYLVAEAGWTFRLWSLPLYLEPFVRAVAAGGLDHRTGSAVRAGDAWSAFAATDGGLRAGWRF